jgi:hypothetical protein
VELPIQVAGVDGIPAAGGSSAPVAGIANVTAVSGTSFTYFTLYPADSPSTPNASDLNVDAQQNTPTSPSSTVPVGSSDPPLVPPSPHRRPPTGAPVTPRRAVTSWTGFSA